MKKEDGYLILDSLNVSQVIPRDNGSNILKFYNGQEVYFKESSLALSIGHIFSAKILKSIGVKVVEVDIAKYNNHEGLISTSYNPDHLKEITLKNVLDKYFLEVIIKKKHKSYIKSSYDLYNLEDLSSALFYFFKNEVNTEEIVSSLMNDIIRLFFCQFILGWYDMHYRNIVILKGKDFHLAPFFDFDGDFSLDLNSNYYVVSLNNKRLNPKKRNKPIEILEDSLNNYYNYFKSIFNTLPTKEEILNEIQFIKNLSPNLLTHICYDKYIFQINELLKRYENIFLIK